MCMGLMWISAFTLPRFSVPEKELLLAVLRQGDAMLHNLATTVLRDGLEALRKP